MFQFKPKFYIKWPSIQLNFEKNWYNYLSLSLFFPYIIMKKKINKNFNIESERILAFNASTILSFSYSNKYVGLKIIILGFGFGFLRQWDL